MEFDEFLPILIDIGHQATHLLGEHMDPEDTFVEKHVNSVFENYDHLIEHKKDEIAHRIIPKKVLEKFRKEKVNF